MAHSAVTLPDGRLHLQEGPIDIVIGLAGTRAAQAEARTRATAAFTGLLAALVAELPLLRTPLAVDPPALLHPVARRMAAACWPHRRGFITPMAAVAGAVADHLCAALAEIPGLTSAYINNGGDIALHLAPGATLHIGLVRSLRHAAPEGMVRVAAADPIRGIATSGWPGRSFSLGIADAVTILAASAAGADAAATLIGNATNAQHPAIQRAPAHSLEPDSDLGAQLVTTAVGPLPEGTVAEALEAGAALAETLLNQGHIHAALIAIGPASRVVGQARLSASVYGNTP